MREKIKTSLLSILCVVATTATANAAPTVRTINGTYDSAAAAAAGTTSSRAGSLRTGGYIRPTATVSTSSATPRANPTTSVTTGTASSGGSVSTGGGTVGRVASTPRLSIGKYVGAPKSISSSGGGASSDLLQRVEKLEGDVELKQNALSDSTYITVSNDELVLDLDKIKQDLELQNGTDGREIEMGTNDEGLLWRYVGDTDWQTLISWSTISEKLDFAGIETSIATAVANLRTELMGELDKKLDIHQGTGESGELIGTTMVIDGNGDLKPGGGPYIPANQGSANQGKALIVNESGIVEAKDIDLDTTGMVPIHQGDDPNLIGMAMVVNGDGDLEPTGDFVTAGELDNLIEAYDLDDFGQLAYMDSVGSEQINANAVNTEELAAGAVTRAKLASDIVDSLDDVQWVQKWEDWWNENKPGEGDYVMSVQADGTRQWFRVITADDIVEDTPEPNPDTPVEP